MNDEEELWSDDKNPKVRIVYTSAVEGMQKKELPFVVGAIADLSNKPIVDKEGNKVAVKKRAFKTVDRNNFKELMAATAPEVTVQVKNELDGSGGTVGGKLVFKSIEEFRPDHVARKVPALNALLQARMMLAELKDRLKANENVEKELNAVIERTMLLTGETPGKEV